MKRTSLLITALALPFALVAQNSYNSAQEAAKAVTVKVDTSREPIQKGKYKPTWESLSDYECPTWFRDAKFGIWAHWGPQCQPEYGDWFARRMYEQGSDAYTFSKEARNPQKDFGFKDWIHEWKAENWNPEKLVKLYQECGAKYFFALANHHDNFDLWDSKYQPWNATSIGPKKNLIAGWAAACRKLGLPLGLSVHAAHAWTWYETSRGADKMGTFKGKKYDGNLTKADGKGTWWDGLDPQDLYEQRHELSKNSGEWDWDPAQVTVPDQAYCNRFYNRTMDLINKYNPSVVYFDDTVLPLYPFSDAGLQLTAHLYNKSMAENNGRNKMVVTGKVLKDWHKKAIVWDVERGAPDRIQPLPWQTCTCIGSWHYDKRHLFTYAGEDGLYTRGEDRVVVRYGGLRFLLQVCYDLRFPVFSRNRGDYDVAIYVANWPTLRLFAWQTLLRARAIENQCFVLGVNRVGNDPANAYSGGTVALDPQGQTLAECRANEVDVAHATLSLECLEGLRRTFPVMKDGDVFIL